MKNLLLLAIALIAGCSSLGDGWRDFRDEVNANPVGDWLFPDNVTERALSAYEDGYKNLTKIVDKNLASLSTADAARYADLKLDVARALQDYGDAKMKRDLRGVVASGERIRAGLGKIGQLILDTALAKGSELVGLF